jgi:hypothetical protein
MLIAEWHICSFHLELCIAYVQNNGNSTSMQNNDDQCLSYNTGADQKQEIIF